MISNKHAPRKNLRIGVVSTRFASNDGVSLETDKWVHVLQEHLGHTCFFLAGICDGPEERSHIVDIAHFKHPDIRKLQKETFSKRERPMEVTKQITSLKDKLKQELIAFVEKFDIQLLIIENALAIPMNVPLGLAITEFIAETGFPTIAHHHDFFWERTRFLVNCVWDYLNMAFPPHLPSIHHVVINTSGQNQLSLRTGISSTLIPNVMDFDNPPEPPDDYTSSIREDLGIKSDEHFFLQPTRIVQRKGIEHAIELICRLERKARLIISHASGDEGDEYEHHVRRFAELLKVKVNFVSDIISEKRSSTEDGRRIYTLWDVYPHADLITYPSNVEGFGNAFLETIYFRRPIVVNTYSIYDTDIKPKGFRVVEFDGFITENTLNQVHNLLENEGMVQEMVEHNYRIARKHYSFTRLETQLKALITEALGEENSS